MRHDELIADAVERRGGRFLKSMGETRPSRCSTRRPARSPPRSPPPARCRPSSGPDDLRIAVRFGIHTGEAERRGDRLPRAGGQPRRARARPGRRRADPPLVGHQPSWSPGICPRAARSSTSARTASVALGAPERIHALKAPGPPTPPSGDRVPLPRPARVRARRSRLLLRARSGRRGAHRAAGAGQAARRRRRVGQRQVVGAARRRRRRRARGRGRRAAARLAAHPGAAPALDVRDEPDGSSSSTSSRSCSRCARTPVAGRRSSTRCCGCAAPSRSACAPTCTAGSPLTPSSRARSPPTSCCSGR